jgi:hypothetical protein
MNNKSEKIYCYSCIFCDCDDSLHGCFTCLLINKNVDNENVNCCDFFIDKYPIIINLKESYLFNKKVNEDSNG